MKENINERKYEKIYLNYIILKNYILNILYNVRKWNSFNELFINYFNKWFYCSFNFINYGFFKCGKFSYKKRRKNKSRNNFNYWFIRIKNI